MNIQLVSKNKDEVSVGMVPYGHMVLYQNYIYIKVDTTKVGLGIRMTVTSGHTVLLNLKHGTLREVPDASPVVLLTTKEPINAYKITDTYTIDTICGVGKIL